MTTPASVLTDATKWLVVIPARLKSERLPAKPLADLGGKPLIIRVYENLTPLRDQGAQVVVAVDHKDTAGICEAHKVPYVMTDEAHQSGTDRCAEVASKYPSRPFVLNVQGDEPFVNLDDLRRLMSAMESSNHPMGTLGYPRRDWDAYMDPNIVKIVVNAARTAIYFSRAPVPFHREAVRKKEHIVEFWQHLGVYAFRGHSLAQFCALPPSPLEQTEKLEQLRAISAGWSIFIATANHPSIGIDTPEDLAAAQRTFRG